VHVNCGATSVVWQQDVSATIQARVEPEERRAFAHLLEQALAPLMPLVINFGISANDLSAVVRAIYLREIEARLRGERGHQISDARIALATGLSRNEVARVRSGRDGVGAVNRETVDQLGRIAGVLSVWHTNPKFAGAYGLPLDLDVEPVSANPQRSFAHLIETACADLPQTVTLDELIGSGVAEVVGDGSLVRCRARAAISNSNKASGKAGTIAEYGRLLANAAGTAARNIVGGDEFTGFFDRLLVSDAPMSESSRLRFSRHAQSSTDAFLTELDRWLSTNVGGPSEGSDRRYGIGVFFFEDSHDQGAASAQAGAFQRNS
jgi:hypothetical protein